jgi:hypothetical protein
MLLAMNLQQSSAAGPRIQLELASLFELCLQCSGSSFDTLFLRGGQVDGESIQLGLMM